MKNYLNLSLIITIVFLSGCDIIEDNYSISPLDSKINFKVIESFDHYEAVSTPDVFIELETEKIYPCFNYSIETNYKVENKKIKIEIIGIYKPDICLHAFGPADARINLGKISGIYEVQIYGKKFSNKYNLLISDSLLILDGKETPNTRPLENFVYRYPRNSFIFFCGTTNSDNPVCSDFIDTLRSVINLTEFNFSDIAEIPYFASIWGHQYDAGARYFYYETENDFHKIESVMRSYIQSHFTDSVPLLTIMNWMNKKVRSWLL